MNFLDKQIAPPAGWDKFEDLCRALFAAVFGNPLAMRNGRSGQPQHGVDVYVELPNEPGGWVGIQCKGKESGYGAKATAKEFDAELAKADQFEPRLSRWIFVTTAPDDGALQAHVRKVSKARTSAGTFPVEVLGWRSLQSLIAQHEKVLRQFYSEHVSPLIDDAAKLERASTEALAGVDDTLRHGASEICLIRSECFVRASEGLASDGIVRLTGEGGAGKSGVLKRVANAFAGPRLVLKDNRVTAKTLTHHLAQLGIHSDAAGLLDQFAGDGPALCVIDGADRLLMSERRGVVIDVLRAILASHTRAQWRIITTARSYQDRDVVADALSEAGITAHGGAVPIEAITDADVETLAVAFPSFAQLLARGDLDGQNRSLFLLRELLKRAVPPTGAVTELDIADAWAAGEGAESGRAALRSRALAQIGSALVTTPWRLPGRAEIDAEGLQALIDEGSVLQMPNRDALRLVHDVHEDWLLARHLHARCTELPQILRDAGEPLWWLRAVRLSGQLLVEAGDLKEWRGVVAQLEATQGLDPAWARTVLAAPLYSERAETILGALEPMLLADEASLLRSLLDTLIVFETRLDERMLAHLADQDETTRYTLAAYWKIPRLRSWAPFLRWSLPRWRQWPAILIPRLSEVAGIFMRATQHVPNSLSRSIAEVVSLWLVELEDAHHTDWETRHEPFGVTLDGYRAWQEVENGLRETLVHAIRSAPDEVRAYLVRLTTIKELDEPRAKLIEAPGAVPAQASPLSRTRPQVGAAQAR